ncbi:hypothetical protein RN001_012002 [Aquatica leii]|uniref:Lipase domain-containing protein n=1 Tax=Aquatica leii TaxID=1421715 RepID=A0AAN7SPB3_9COLE|nr:hypothetical protein RN001_012002 [Aquatica leii]
MLSYFYVIVCACAFFDLFKLVNTGPWASPAQERLDEVNDVEMYNAIVTSIKKWKAFKLEKKLRKREKREEPSVCYPDIGCFEAQGPFAYLEMLPGPPEEIDTKFIFHPSHKYRKKGFSQVEVSFNNLSDAFKWDQQGFNTDIATKVLIHGFGSDCSHVWVYELRSALMAVEDMNIICVDWSKGAELPNYVKAVVNTRLVGKQVALLLKGLINEMGLIPSNIHLIGFSLGAHVAGFAGSDLKNLSRITGLDPAGPLFEAQDPRARLDQTDAHFVDVIHSNGENLILGGLGSWQPLGHVDFYPNGGRMQKGCSNIFLGAVSDIIWSSTVEGRSLCNHRRAYKFFIDSVSPRCHFPSFPCNSYDEFLEGRCFPCTDSRNCGNMGYYADRWNGRGQLYLITRDEEPFCAHQYKIQIQSSTTDIPIVSYGKIQVMLVGDSTLNETFVMTKKDDEEMVLGHAISRIFVPHPILSEPTKIEVLYTAYSGWISSGLTHWKIDKITISDSFGKLSSVCQKSLILESGKPVTLPLYPGECNVPLEADFMNQTDNEELVKSSSNDNVETITQDKINKLSISDAMSMLNITWNKLASDTENTVIDEKETSRALNTKINEESVYYKLDSLSTKSSREIVEPVLKPQSRKNARSHNYDADKPEISEPILVSTTTKFSSNANDLPKPNGKELNYNFYDSTRDEWGSITNVNEERDTWKRENIKHEISKEEEAKKEKEYDGFGSIFMTVQFLPVKLAKMFEQAEKYARETILPFVSAHTPKIIRDFIAPEQPVKYLPLHFDDSTDIETDFQNYRAKPHTEISATESYTMTNIVEDSLRISTTPYTHIQKIFKRKDIFSASSEMDSEAQASNGQPARIQRLDFSERPKSFSVQDYQSKSNFSQQIFIDLPVFEDNSKIKYIPVSPEINKEKKPN